MSIYHVTGTTTNDPADNTLALDEVDDIYDPIVIRVINTGDTNDLKYVVSTKIDRGAAYVIEQASSTFAANASGTAFEDMEINHVCAAIQIEIDANIDANQTTYDVSISGRRR